MSIIVVNNFIDSIQKIRLFDSKTQRPTYDLPAYSQFEFQVFEPGIRDPIIKIGNSDISISSEHRGYSENMINIKIAKEILNGFISNPANTDKIREYRLLATDRYGTQVLLAQDCFYIEDSLMGR